MSPDLDIAAARRVLSVVDAGLIRGAGAVAAPGRVCLEQAIALALGDGLTDEPRCVHAADRRWGLGTNDSCPLDDAQRAAALRKVSVYQLGTAGTDRGAWVRALALGAIREVLPIALRAAQIEEHALACEQATTLAGATAAAREAKRAAEAYRAADSAGAAAAYYADYAAYHAGAAADYAAYAAAAAAHHAGAAADYAGAAAARGYAASAAGYAAYAGAAAAAYFGDYADYAASAAGYASAAAARGYAPPDAGGRERVWRLGVAVAERAYEETGSPGVDLWRQMQGAEVSP